MYSRTGQQSELSPLSGQLFGITPLAIALFSIFGVALVVGLASLQRDEAYKLSLSSLAVGGAIFQLLPTLKGYFFYGSGDPSNYVGTMLTVQRTGALTAIDPYPALHIIGAVIGEATSLPLFTVTTLLQEIFYIVFLVGGCVLVRSIFAGQIERRVAFLMLPAMPLGYLLFPQYYGLALIPLLVFLSRSNTRSALASYVILLLGLSIIHPLVTLLFVAATWLWTAVHKRKIIDQRVILGLGVVVFLFGYNGLLTFSIASIISHLALGVPVPGVSEAVSKLGLLSSAKVLLQQAGLAPLLAVIEMALWLRMRKLYHGTILIYFVAFSFVLIVPALLISSFDLGYQRLVWYIEFGALLMSGIVATQMKVRWKRILLGTFLILVFMSAVVTTFPSSYNLYGNDQLTYSNYASYGWLFLNAPVGAAIGGPLFAPTNAWNLVLGTPTQAVGSAYFVYPFSTLQVNYHFYNMTAGPNGTILVITTLAIGTYLNYYKGTNTFTASDFHTLTNSSRYNIVFSGSDEQFFSLNNR